jgi:UDP-GlcNAc:undecaprenyl-phosphate/decaprenyl-phosphate GlcNAc-1-phosphate transferase
LLYCFLAGLCGVVLSGVVSKNEFLAVVMGVSGCLAFLLILTSRRDELATLRSDLASRMARGKQERFAAKVTWEAIQRIELCETPVGIWDIMRAASRKLGCDLLSLDCRRDGRVVFHSEGASSLPDPWAEAGPLSGPMATFRLSSGRDLLLIAMLDQDADSTLAADIAFRFVQRLSLASAERLDRLSSKAEEAEPTRTVVAPKVARESSAGLVPAASMTARDSPAMAPGATALELAPSPSARPPMGWLREALGWPSSPASPARSLGED